MRHATLPQEHRLHDLESDKPPPFYGQRRSKRKTEKIIAELTDGQGAQKKT
jgi:hypothetical protein